MAVLILVNLLKNGESVADFERYEQCLNSISTVDIQKAFKHFTIPINLYCYILENIKNMNNLFFSRFCGLLLLCSIGVAAFAQKGYKRAYTLFNAEGKEIGYDELIEALAQPDVVFIGEIHNCCITHWLEYEITRSLYAIHKEKLMLGAEMLEADNQLILDEYMSSRDFL